MFVEWVTAYPGFPLESSPRLICECGRVPDEGILLHANAHKAEHLLFAIRLSQGAVESAQIAESC